MTNISLLYIQGVPNIMEHEGPLDCYWFTNGTRQNAKIHATVDERLNVNLSLEHNGVFYPVDGETPLSWVEPATSTALH